MPKVDFYVLDDAAPDAHLRLTCRLTEQAVEAGQKVFIRTASAEESKRIDDLLWTFGDRSFMPHELASSDAPSHDMIHVLIGEQEAPIGFRDLVINFAASAPTQLDVGQVAEIVPADPERKRLARERFKHYRDRSLQPQTHNVGSSA
jgi:DNA polymerase-3 subunit chi